LRKNKEKVLPFLRKIPNFVQEKSRVALRDWKTQRKIFTRVKLVFNGALPFMADYKDY
jgi:hypothetical protein